MTNQNVREEQTIGSENNHSHKETSMVSEILKRTNQLIKIGDLDRAQVELLIATKAAKEQYIRSIISSPVKERFIVPQAPAESLPLTPLEAILTVVSSNKQTGKIQPNSNKQIQNTPSEKSQIPEVQQANDRDIEFNCYREALAKAWVDGALTEDEERQLQELRTVLEILDTEHEMFEKEIKHLCYKDALAKHLTNGSNSLSDRKLINKLQKTYNISEDEHLQIQNVLMQTLQLNKRDKILIIDDDIQYLDMLSDSMKEDGFDVTAVSTSDEAHTILQSNIPDVILCDINLKTSTMNGFVLYEKIQADKNLRNIPFVFLTGLIDEKLACTGKELGADDYLTKPVSRNTLLSTLHGRLRRFRQIRSFSPSPTSAFC